MNKNNMLKEIREIMRNKGIKSDEKVGKIYEISERFCNRIQGKKEAPQRRDTFVKMVNNFLIITDPDEVSSEWDRKKALKSRERRFEKWIEKNAEFLAKKAGYEDDEYEYKSGDYHSINAIDYIGKYESNKKPYFDMGGEGIGLIEVTRKRVYARTSNYSQSYASTRFLVGRNEDETYFSHPVSPNCETVLEATSWVWKGMQDRIISRQGNIALISSSAGPKVPKLPSGYKVVGDYIVHDIYPSIPAPKKGQRIIVGRTAAARVLD